MITTSSGVCGSKMHSEMLEMLAYMLVLAEGTGRTFMAIKFSIT